MTIFCATPQWTALVLLAVPTPMIEPETTWVVETGRWSKVAPKTTIEEFKSAEKPLAGSSLKIFPPTVFIIRQPPVAVPTAIAVAQRTLTNVGTSNSVRNPPENSARVIIPIDFWASFEPWEKAMAAAATIWSLRNLSLTACGEDFWRKIHRAFIMTKPVKRAMAGEAIRAIMIVPIPSQFSPI